MAMLRAALYCRLSKDDMLQGDSESIKTQKAMLTQYAKEHGFLVVEIYVDDGYSGLNFDRPSFTRMLDDIEAGTCGKGSTGTGMAGRTAESQSRRRSTGCP